MQIKRSSGPKITTIIAGVLMTAGLYILATALSPALLTPVIDPDNNATTKLLASTERKITEQRLYIPKIDVNVSYSIGDALALEKGAWWRRPENGSPVDGGNFILSAHRFVMGPTPQGTLQKSPFYNIGRMAIGDEIIVDYQGSRYHYIIDKIFAVTPDAVEIEERTDQPQLTLYSCTLGGSADGRDVIIAKLKS